MAAAARSLLSGVQRFASPGKRKPGNFVHHAPEAFSELANSRGDWSTELHDVCGEPGGFNMFCLSTWCPCMQYGMLMEQLPPGSAPCAGSVAGGCAAFCVLWLLGDLLGAVLLTKVVTLPCTALVHCQARGYIRRKYNIQSHPLHDFFITWCCGPCALCQEARELVVREAADREDSNRPILRGSAAGALSAKSSGLGPESLIALSSSGSNGAANGFGGTSSGGAGARAATMAHPPMLVQATGVPVYPATCVPTPSAGSTVAISLGAGVATVTLPPGTAALSVEGAATITSSPPRSSGGAPPQPGAGVGVQGASPAGVVAA
ncbi:hypothetical protein HYH03_017460 [Edaphochlamys debaryana]|uniref:Uncharacterized protein n=1 Tax=Edaphochlamys debaryana TaxID=47281 RepID=A0A836BP86_9CHLO|nr:hypothetical protein HYH03_017460 [Edaphochlamys debaryana]|eukprot:KAG2483657.1 hypothetical protein HYH03_017460 [Edaphochlamys debaryana]